MSRYPFNIDVLGREYSVRRTTAKSVGRGDCGCPYYGREKRIIRLRVGLSRVDEAKYLIHELMHAMDWEKSEEWVAETAEVLTDALQKADLLNGGSQ